MVRRFLLWLLAQLGEGLVGELVEWVLRHLPDLPPLGLWL